MSRLVYVDCSTEEASKDLWLAEVLKDLQRGDTVQVDFNNISNWYELRKRIYAGLRGWQFDLERPTRTTAVLRCYYERVRTREEVEQSTLPSPRSVSTDVQDQHNDFGLQTYKRCPVCGHRLSSEAFSKRSVNNGAPQSYCKQCQRAYAQWRYQFLKAHGALCLVDKFTEGHCKPNKYFLAWYREQQLR